MKLPVIAQQMVDATTPMENNHQTPTALGHQLEDPPRVAAARAAPAVAAVVLDAVTATAEATAGEAHHMAQAEERVAAAITGAEATRTTMSPATHVTATMPATGLTRFVAKRQHKQATATASPPTLLGFTIYSSPRNSRLSGSPSTT
jgi:hypothetical protein